MRALKLASLLLWLLGGWPARAVFVKTEMERIDHEPLFDEHYFLSLLSFSYPAQWDNLWSQSPAAPAYRINAASLDCCDLYLQQELRFKKILVEGLAFRFDLVERNDKERQERHHWLEFEKSLPAGFSASIFGEPAFRKEEADIGFGLSWARGPFRAGVRRAFVDFSFNKRGSTSQSYDSHPVSDEFSLEWDGAASRGVARLELDWPLRRVVPDENRVFSYRRTTLVADLSRKPPGSLGQRLEYRYEFQRKGNLYGANTAATSIESARRVHRILASLEAPLGPKDSLEAGHALLLRSARSDFAYLPQAGVFYRRWESQPYARWRRTIKPWLLTDLGAFLSFGENRRRFVGASAPSVFEVLTEAKLGAGLDFLFGPSGRVGVYSTFELDRPSGFWGGGNIRAMFFF